MSQKVLSFFLAFALVLSLTRIVFLTDVRAEEIAEARNDVVVSPSQVENSLPPLSLRRNRPMSFIRSTISRNPTSSAEMNGSKS